MQLVRLGPVDIRCHLVIGERKRSESALDHRTAELWRKRPAKVELSAAAKTLFFCPVSSLAPDAHAVHARMNALVDDRRSDGCRSNIAPSEEGELSYTGSPFRDICAPAREAGHENLIEISPQMADAPWLMLLDERNGLIEPLQNIVRGYVRSGILHYDRKTADFEALHGNCLFSTAKPVGQCLD